jgi:hypothetical protein
MKYIKKKPVIFLLLTMVIVSCSFNDVDINENHDLEESTLELPEVDPVELTDTPAINEPAPTAFTPTNVPAPTAFTPTNVPAPTSITTPIAQSTPKRDSLYYNLPALTLTEATPLYVSPKSLETISPVVLPTGETVFAMGKNATNSHIRIVWNTGVGWVPTSFTSYNGNATSMATLPVYKHEPPACVIPVTTQWNFNNTWTSNRRQRIAVVTDLFRAQYGDFPDSYISLTVNGISIESSRRQIKENGQFSLKDVILTLPGNLQEGDVLGYKFDTSSSEPLVFVATIFSIPQGCNWEL